jgi:hypothetical protein
MSLVNLVLLSVNLEDVSNCYVGWVVIHLEK